MLLTHRKRLRQIAGLLETTSVLSLKLYFKRRAQTRSFPGLVFRDYMSLVKQDRWRSQEIFELFPEIKERRARVVLEHLPGEGVEARVEVLAYLALATAAIQPKVVFEFGTFRGRTALNFALNSPPECRVFTLDVPQEERSQVIDRSNYADAHIIRRSQTGIDYAGRDVTPKIEQLYGDSTRFDFRPFHGEVDLVFVDGGHDYEVARSDTRNALAMLRPGGVVIWDEFANYGDYHDVTRAILDEVPADQVVQISNTQLAAYRKLA